MTFPEMIRRMEEDFCGSDGAGVFTVLSDCGGRGMSAYGTEPDSKASIREFAVALSIIPQAPE